MNEEILEIVDEKDHVIGVMPRARIHAEKRRHRSVHIFVWDTQGRLYLQQRAPNKDEHPDKWDSSAAGHVDPQESYLDAARRELKEELNLTASPNFITKLNASPATGWEFVCFYEMVTAEPISINRDEIATGRFFSRAEIDSWLAKTPDRFTPAFPVLWRIYLRRCG